MDPVKQNEIGANWPAYYEAVRNRPPRETLVQALALSAADASAASKRAAIDLGCGSGIDTFALLQHGWHVLAIDRQPEAIDQVQAATPPEYRARLETRLAAFGDLALPPADLINASFSLPFCHPQHFGALWATITSALNPGGYFAGHFFGNRDGWAHIATMTFHTAGQVQALLQGFDRENVQELEEDGTTALGEPKHWHVFSVVARKR